MVVKRCYAKGLVEKGSGFLLTMQANPATFENCFWDIETTTKTNSAAGTGKTTQQMKNINTFTEWDISELSSLTNETWYIADSIGYPKLSFAGEKLDVSNKVIMLSEGESVTTKRFAMGNIFTYYTVSIGELTGSVLVEITGDNGKTWETVTLDTKIAFGSNDGSGVKIRITENNSSNATITNTYTYGEYDEPGIKCILEDD